MKTKNILLLIFLVLFLCDPAFSWPTLRTWKCYRRTVNGVQIGCIWKGTIFLAEPKCMIATTPSGADCCQMDREEVGSNFDCGSANIPTTGDYVETEEVIDMYPPESFEGFPLERIIKDDGTVIYYTVERTEQEARNILIAAGYTPQDEWFTSVEAMFRLCPAPVQDLPVTISHPDVNNLASYAWGCSAGTFTIAPNPTSTGIFTLNLSELLSSTTISDITIYRLSDNQSVYNQTSNFVINNSVDLSSQSAGQFSVQVTTSAGTKTRRLIIE